MIYKLVSSSFMLKWQENGLPAEGGFLQRAAYSFWEWLTLGKQAWCKCWPHTNRLLDISPAEMGFFRLSRQFQFRVCNHGGQCANPLTAREGEVLERGKRSWKGSVNLGLVHGFSLVESLPGKSLSYSCRALRWSQQETAPPSSLLALFIYWGFSLQTFYTERFMIRLF